METDLLRSLLKWYPLIPGAILCFAPMQNQLKRTVAQTLRNTAVFLGIVFISLVLLECFVQYHPVIFPGFMLLCFAFYFESLKVHISKALGMFFYVCTLMALLINCTIGFDAYLHPESDIYHVSMEALAFRMLLTTLVALFMFYPMSRYGSMLIDDFDFPSVWYINLPVAFIILVHNFMVTVRKYETLHVNNVLISYWSSVALLFMLLGILTVLFYRIVFLMNEARKAAEGKRLLEMQESLYSRQRQYMEDSARVRHDFRQSLRIILELAEQEKWQELKAYLADYEQSLPKNEMLNFCGLPSLNALLNYYYSQAVEQEIEAEFEIQLPKLLPLSEIELCGMIGNILDNAVAACKEVPQKQRFIDLSLKTNEEEALFIVATNSFDGNIRFRGGKYLSTRRQGSGMGLSSVSLTARRCGGSASFSHKGKQFYSDVVLPAK